MIQGTSPEPENWKQQLLQSYSSITDLQKATLITSEEAVKLQSLGEKFKVRVTPYYAGLMKATQDCPIRNQAIPHLNELDPILPDWAIQLSQEIYGRPYPWHPDSIGDIQNLAAPRITHRYRHRAILHLSSMCAVYCRFCFRKSHLNDDERTLYEGNLDPAFRYLEKEGEIRELILTGGDPLSLSDAAFNRVLERISKIPQIRSVRIHSRMAVTLPSRFTSSLLEILEKNWGFHIALVSHFNHPRELTLQALLSLKNLRKSGVTLLNQSVLLNKINASVDCLTSLFQNLYEVGVIPYYLHHPDWTPGTFHFRMSIDQGQEIVSQLRGTLSGPALPDYILEIPQGYGKTSLLGQTVRKLKDLPEFRTPSSDHPIQGALYEITSPHTRQSPPARHLYLDLFPKPSN